MFRNDFIWGTATSSYQIEGAAFEEGKGLSVWDVFCEKESAIFEANNGNIACDHYHKYKNDIAIMKEIGIKAYRFSISWPRVMPDGEGIINEKGLDFYSNLVDFLLENGIEPHITLFHWDFPFELYKKGGWLNDNSPEWFAQFTKVVVQRLSDRVKNWFTINEPQCFIGAGHVMGVHAPGVKMGLREYFAASHNALLAHGRAVQTIRQYSKSSCKIGYAPVGMVKIPQTNSEADIKAAYNEMFSMTVNEPIWTNTWWMDPVLLGKYPNDGIEAFERYLPIIRSEDLKTISQPLDFFGTNIYTGTRVCAGKDGKAQKVTNNNGFAKTAIDWTIEPESLYWGPKFFYERYKKPIIVTENGLSSMDWISLDDKVHDAMRIDFLKRYLQQLNRAANDNIDIRGYFHWSFLDNFEWARGYQDRFGLVFVDYQTQKRTPKDSAYFYKNVIETNGEIISQLFKDCKHEK